MHSTLPQGGEEGELTATASDQVQPAIPSPKWVPFWVVIGLVCVLLGAPTVFAFVTPKVETLPVGVFERASLSLSEEQTEDETSVIGGFIAPEGWFEVKPEAGEAESSDEQADEAPSQRTFVSSTGRDRITVELVSGVDSPEALLQERAPIGTSLTPIGFAMVPREVLPVEGGVELSALDIDLRAGSASTQLITACSTRTPTVCALITSEAQAWFGDPRFAQRQEDGVMLPEVRSMLSTLEVFA